MPLISQNLPTLLSTLTVVTNGMGIVCTAKTLLILNIP